ncbi:MAG TPA: hypothetical protein VGI44_07435 [Acidimicrobiales bacterium]
MPAGAIMPVAESLTVGASLAVGASMPVAESLAVGASIRWARAAEAQRA